MKLFNHPLHVMLIHFPAALLPMELILSILEYKYDNESFNQAAFYCLIGGVGIGYLAMITGLIDVIFLPKEKRMAMGTALLHGGVNGGVILAYTVLAYKAWPGTSILNSSMNFIALKSVLVLTLFTGNFFGGKLIYKFHIGIDNKSYDKDFRS